MTGVRWSSASQIPKFLVGASEGGNVALLILLKEVNFMGGGIAWTFGIVCNAPKMILMCYSLIPHCVGVGNVYSGYATIVLATNRV